MSYRTQLDKEEDYLCDQLNRGEITVSEYNRQVRELHREWQAAAEEAAQDAHDREMDRW